MPGLFRRTTEVAQVVDPAVVAVERGDQVAALRQLLADVRAQCAVIINKATVRDQAAGEVYLMLTVGLLSPDVEARVLEGASE